MIRFILQVEGQNLLQVVYESGANRYIYPDSWGDYTHNMTKTQRDFYNNSIVAFNKGFSPWEHRIKYWFRKESPDSFIKFCSVQEV